MTDLPKQNRAVTDRRFKSGVSYLQPISQGGEMAENVVRRIGQAGADRRMGVCQAKSKMLLTWNVTRADGLLGINLNAVGDRLAE